MEGKIARKDIIILVAMFLFMGLGAKLNSIFFWSDSMVTICEKIKNPIWVYYILGAFGGICIYLPLLLIIIETQRAFHKR